MSPGTLTRVTVSWSGTSSSTNEAPDSLPQEYQTLWCLTVSVAILDETCRRHNSTSFLPRWGVVEGTQSLSNCTHSWDNQFHHHGLHLQASPPTGSPHWTIYVTNQPVSKVLAGIFPLDLYILQLPWAISGHHRHFHHHIVHFWVIRHSSDRFSSRSGSVDYTASQYDALIDATLLSI